MEMNRREFLRTAGKAALGAVAVSSLPLPVMAEGKEAPVWPWKYVPLDKDELLKRCYEKFFEYGGCGGGCFGGIIDIMSEVTGYPYNEMVPGRVCALMGGGFGTGTLCGSLAGALVFVGLVCEPQDAAAVRDELFAWYREHSFPQYQPEFESITTVAHSVNCVDSVGTYMEATGYKMADPERKARCAAVTAEVAVKTITLLNVLYGYEEPEPVIEEAAPAEAALADNEYIGTGVSEIGGEVKVKVTMDGDKIAKIEVLSHNETAGVSDPAFAAIPDAIIAANSTEIDTVSGATRTSEALIAAVNDALAQIKK
ncbi:MAG: FMN-binding protein [Clostridia bacterium]|nr:FMN-binding protein [Clostridia bacterium]